MSTYLDAVATVSSDAYSKFKVIGSFVYHIACAKGNGATCSIFKLNLSDLSEVS